MSARRRPCGVCPIWKAGWCSHLAEMRPPKAPACDFGLHEMNKEYYKNYSANRRKLAKEQMSNSRPNPAGEIGRIGNAAKLREAIKAVVDVGYPHNFQIEAPHIRGYCYEITEAIKKCFAALAAPPRNCDVGTAMEQGERFLAYCRAHKHPESECLNCPIIGETCGYCELAWAQMPYEEGGAK